MLIQIFASFIAIFSFSIIFNIPKSELVYCGIAGVVCWIFYYISAKNYSIMTSTFIASIVVTLISKFLSIKRKKPFTVFAVPGIIPLVPGTGLYNTIYLIIVDNSDLATKNGIETLKIAGIIAIAIFLVSALPNRFYKFKIKK